jgi:hypothetical protein
MPPRRLKAAATLRNKVLVSLGKITSQINKKHKTLKK